MIDTTSTWAAARAKLAKVSTFQGKPVKAFSPDELLVVIGSLVQQLRTVEEGVNRDLDFVMPAVYRKGGA